ncbi:MAG TPA: AAA family ATPase, partial [Actinomycetes bacterium]
MPPCCTHNARSSAAASPCGRWSRSSARPRASPRRIRRSLRAPASRSWSAARNGASGGRAGGPDAGHRRRRRRRPAGQPEDTLWAVHRLLHARARRRPLVVVIDDLQWADAILLDGIEELVDLSRDTPILLVCIARPDELLAHRQRLPGGKVNTLSLQLSPLGEREGEQLVSHLLGGRVDPEVQALVTERAQGYPLIVEELVANLRDEDLLHAVDGRWALRLDVAGVDSRGRTSIPTSIHALLQVRLERLEAGRRAIVEAASVVGEQFHVGDLEALSQQRTPAGRRAGLQGVAAGPGGRAGAGRAGGA